MEPHADIWGAFLRTGSVLLFVIALLILFLYLVKRFSLFSMGKSDQQLIKVLAVHHLSPKERLVLVEVMNTRLLLGVTPQSIQTLSRFDEAVGATAPAMGNTAPSDGIHHSLTDAPEAADGESSKAGVGSSFQTLFRQFADGHFKSRKGKHRSIDITKSAHSSHDMVLDQPKGRV